MHTHVLMSMAHIRTQCGQRRCGACANVRDNYANETRSCKRAQKPARHAKYVTAGRPTSAADQTSLTWSFSGWLWFICGVSVCALCRVRDKHPQLCVCVCADRCLTTARMGTIDCLTNADRRWTNTNTRNSFACLHASVRRDTLAIDSR